MEKNALIALISVAIIVTAGTGVAIYYNGQEYSKDVTPLVNGTLKVYGNVSEDSCIDNEDVAMLEKIIESGSWDMTEYPFADADQDGKVTDKDVELVRSIISREPCTVHFVDSTERTRTVSFPLEKFVIGGSMLHFVIEALGAQSMAVAYTGTTDSLDPLLDKLTIGLPSVSSSETTIDMSEVYGLGELPGAVITSNLPEYDEIEKKMLGSKVTCIRIDTESFYGSVNDYLLLGMLLGQEETASKIVGFYDRVLTWFLYKSQSIGYFDTEEVLVSHGAYVCGTSSPYVYSSDIIGASDLAEFEEDKDCSSDTDWIDSLYTLDYLIQLQGWNWGKLGEEELVETYVSYGRYYASTDVYNNGGYVCINNNLPNIVKAAYIAQCIYPSVYGEDYGNEVNREFIDEFLPFLSDVDIEELNWVITPGDIQS